MHDTDIDWCDMDNNSIVGCNHNCPWCYAPGWAIRSVCMRSAVELKRKGIVYKHLPVKQRIEMYRTTDAWCEDCYTFTPHAHLERLNQITPNQKPKRIFLDSMFDFNCDENEIYWLTAIIEKLRQCKQHTGIILSKKPEGYGRFVFPDNVWLGTSIADQHDMDRVTELYLTPNDNLKFLSIEPLHGFIIRFFVAIDWIIVGAETGNHKGKITPKHSWIQSIVDNTREVGIPLFMKSNLEPYWSGELIQEFPK